MSKSVNHNEVNVTMTDHNDQNDQNNTTDAVEVTLAENEQTDDVSDDNLSENDSDDSCSEVDLADSELYQVLSLFLQRTPAEGANDDEPTENVTDVLFSLKESVDNLNTLLKNLTSTLATTAQQQSKSNSTSLRRHKSKTLKH